MRNTIISASLLCVLGVSNSALAQEATAPMIGGEDRATLALGMEPIGVAQIGGIYTPRAELLDRPVSVGVMLSAPSVLLDGRHARHEVFARAPLFERERFKIIDRLALFHQSTSNPLYHSRGLGLAENIIVGYFAPRAWIAGELGMRFTFANHITHSDRYIEDVNPDAQSGWYRATVALLQIGAQAGVHIADRVELSLRAGIDTTFRGQGRTAPLFGAISAAWMFGRGARR